MVILLLRGHIRESFDDDDLYNFVKKIAIFSPIEIYISTWNIYANNLSWRAVKEDNRIVDKMTIYNYFRDLKDNIKRIIIDDDTKIVLNGKTEGNVGNGKMPLTGWKNMWYCNHNIMKYISREKFQNDTIINTRIDILKNSNYHIYNKDLLLAFIKFIINSRSINKNHFVVNKEYAGIDNIIAGNVGSMKKLIDHFHNNLDNIIQSYDNGNFNFPQELLVFRENNKIFASQN